MVHCGMLKSLSSVKNMTTRQTRMVTGSGSWRFVEKKHTTGTFWPCYLCWRHSHTATSQPQYPSLHGQDLQSLLGPQWICSFPDLVWAGRRHCSGWDSGQQGTVASGPPGPAAPLPYCLEVWGPAQTLYRQGGVEEAGQAGRNFQPREWRGATSGVSSADSNITKIISDNQRSIWIIRLVTFGNYVI